MEAATWILWTLLSIAPMDPSTPSPPSDLFDIDVRRVAEVWRKERRSPADPYSLKHSDLRRRLKDIARDFPETVSLQRLGASVEGRDLHLVTIGHGPDRIFLWSQMHGDEPTATVALLDLYRFLATHRKEAWVSAILDRYSLLAIPMLNPDGAERGQRRNAQGIDIASEDSLRSWRRLPGARSSGRDPRSIGGSRPRGRFTLDSSFRETRIPRRATPTSSWDHGWPPEHRPGSSARRSASGRLIREPRVWPTGSGSG